MGGQDWMIRSGGAADGAACAAIYAPYVTNTAVSFELEPPTPDEMGRRITAALAAHAWLVMEIGGKVVGYAYAARFSARPAYDWSCEVSIYLEPGRRRTGVGRALYAQLFACLVARGYRTAFAGMVPPNPGSEGLHRALGFTTVGTYRQVGWKFDQWHDVLWLQRRLVETDAPPAPLR